MASLDTLENNYAAFARHFAEGIALRDSIWNQENRSRIAELQILHETEQKALMIEKLRQQNKVRRIRMAIGFAGSGLVLILLVLFIMYLRKRQKLIDQQYLMEKQKAKADLEANRRELTGKALSLAKSDKLLTDLKKELRSMLENPEGENSKDFRAAMRLIKSKDNSRQLWIEFETRFNELNEGFISRLTDRYPSLSPSEIRLCAMLRLQLSTKEIAELINRSTRTIEHTRTSARKKMGLQPCDNLVKYLLSV